MSHRIIIFLLVMGLIGCSQQPEGTQKTAEPKIQDFAVIQISEIRILPENPNSNTALEVDLIFRGGEPERLSYQWLRNGNPIPGAIRSSLGRKHLHKGDFIAVTVRVNQPGGSGDERTADTVTIGNTQPVPSFAGIEPAAPSSSDTLRALGAAYDHDGDEVSFVYQWMVNGETIVGQDEQLLVSKHFRRGDQVQAVVTPYDGEAYGSTLRSAPVAIGNSPPKIVSEPPVRTEAGLFSYAVQTEDVDGDPIRFSLEGKAPAGLEIDPDTGLVQWQMVIPKGKVTYVFQVVAEDPEGAKSIQEITLEYNPGA
jgi:hypothetical protein